MAQAEQFIEDNEEIYDDDEDSQKDKYLTFHLAGEDFGIDIAYVTEIIGIQKITEVPDMPQFIKGVINGRQNPSNPNVISDVALLIKRYVKVDTDEEFSVLDVEVSNISQLITPFI